MKKSKAPIVPSANWKKILHTLEGSKAPTKKRKSAAKSLDNENKRKKPNVEQSIPKKEELWFGDEVSAKDLDIAYGEHHTLTVSKKLSSSEKDAVVQRMDTLEGRDAKVGKFVAIDCEMVGVGIDGVESALARISLVNFNGAVLMDEYVKPQERVTDYRTHVSGIKAEHLVDAITFKEAQTRVGEIINGRTLIGHAVHHDLKALFLEHPRILVRDTSKYGPFRKLAGGRTPSLKTLVHNILGIEIQSGSHSSVEDARFTMELYKRVKADWEKKVGGKSGLRLKRMNEKITKNNKAKKSPE